VVWSFGIAKTKKTDSGQAFMPKNKPCQRGTGGKTINRLGSCGRKSRCSYDLNVAEKKGRQLVALESTKNEKCRNLAGSMRGDCSVVSSTSFKVGFAPGTGAL